MESFSHTKKQIAVSDKNGHTISVLKNIIALSGRENYVVAAAGEPIPQDAQLVVLLLCDPKDVECAKNAPVCVTDYELAALPALVGLNLITYSTTSDSADFTARNIRQTPDGFTAFEMIGVGVIGRVKLCGGGGESINCALASTAAAIACGIPFAEVLDALNRIEMDDIG